MAYKPPKSNKVAIRKRMIRRRNDLTTDEVTELSRKVEENLFSCDEFLGRQRILYYLSFGKEVTTDSMILRSLMFQK